MQSIVYHHYGVFCTLKRDDMQKRAIFSLFLMICTQTSCVMIYHYSVMNKKMTAILYQNCSHFLVRTTGLVGRETSVIAIVAQYAPISSTLNKRCCRTTVHCTGHCVSCLFAMSAAQMQVANTVCRQLQIVASPSTDKKMKDGEMPSYFLVRMTGLEPARYCTRT